MNQLCRIQRLSAVCLREHFEYRPYRNIPFRTHPLRCIGNIGDKSVIKLMSTISSEQKPSSKSQKVDDAYKYFGSEAEKIRAFPTTSPADQNKAYIVSATLAVFLLYFCVLRESNEFDELLERDIYDHFGPEASRLKKAYQYNIAHNLPTGEITNRLRELGAPVPPGV